MPIQMKFRFAWKYQQNLINVTNLIVYYIIFKRKLIKSQTQNFGAVFLGVILKTSVNSPDKYVSSYFDLYFVPAILY